MARQMTAADTILDGKTIQVATEFRRKEVELLELVQQVDSKQVFLKLGYRSLFEYVVQRLQLSESIAYNLISVARKAKEIPALKTAVAEGALSVARARKIVPVLTEENQSTWIEAATSLPKSELERRVANESPFTKIPERIKAVATDRVIVTFGLSRATADKLQRARDILANRQGGNATLEALFESMLDQFLKRHDPVEKAARSLMKTESRVPSLERPLKQNQSRVPTMDRCLETAPSPVPTAEHSAKKLQSPIHTQRPSTKHGVRTAIPNQLLHRVNLRDGGRCTYQHQGRRCTQTRFLHFHHRIPVAWGGAHSLENITTLCSSHHRLTHDNLSMDRLHTENQPPRYALPPTRPRS